MDKQARIFIAGHKGLVGTALINQLRSLDYQNLIVATKEELDLRDPLAVDAFFAATQPEYIFLAAAKVGGIHANNTYPAEFIYDNLMIQTNVIHNAYKYQAKKLLFLGSSCIYPKYAPQPIRERYLMTGLLEPTNEAYAIAKIVGIKMCQSYNRQYGTNFITVMPSNLYGPFDNFDLETSHVLPALIRKFHEAKVNKASLVELWGSGSPRREFLHVADLASACLFLMEHYSDNEPVNVGAGFDISIAELAQMVKKIIGYHGKIVWDSSKPDGTPRKLLDIRKITGIGWKPKLSLKEGIKQTYEWFLANKELITR
ncbi:MAG TPA: GDP-L-fucose synthase [Bacillota bacterium]|nr:GDP-L-fucose synthase [Bacillota bacterium]HOL10539.1 GDP-L-fucose synthase [Bacillota bacterium]HPO98269.1 GDP-L-fucose synthase [Bacillota bacterium]